MEEKYKERVEQMNEVLENELYSTEQLDDMKQNRKKCLMKVKSNIAELRREIKEISWKRDEESKVE